MGWTFSPSFTKESIKEEVTAPFTRPNGSSFKTLKASFRGNTLWALHESDNAGEVVRYVGCYLLKKSGGEWGYKDMDETAGPYYYDCPVSYLDAATAPFNDISRQWREKVRDFAAKKAKEKAKKPVPGEVWSLVDCKIDKVFIVSVKPLIGKNNNNHYKIKRKLLGERLAY